MSMQTMWTGVSCAFILVAASGVDAAGWHGESSMLGGTSRYDDGEWIHQDFIYDDYGADTVPAGSSNVVSLAPTTGDFRYPDDADRYANNAADVMEVRARLAGPDLEVRVRLNTLLVADSTVIGIAVDRGEGTLQPWPFGAGIESVWQQHLTVAAGIVIAPDGNAIGTAVTDLEENTVTFEIPGGGQGASVALTVATGLWDAAGGEWLACHSTIESGDGFDSGGASAIRVFDLAFNTREVEPRGGDWQEEAQAAALASGDVSAFARAIDLSRLSARSTDEPILGPGFYNRIFESRQDLGEGVSPDGFPQYRGKFQPYGLWIPTGYDPSQPAPLLLLLHSLSVHHNQYGGGLSYPTMYDQLDELGAVIVTPLARGPDGWYWDEGLVDTLEVWKDVAGTYTVDPNRTSVSGYSMGGYATYRLATLMPDRFASAVSWVGPPAYQIWPYPLDPVPSGERQGPGNTYHQLENVEHIPFMIIHGTNDELVPVTGVVNQAERLRALGYRHVFNLHPALDHFLFVFLDQWQREVSWLREHDRRSKRPGHVIFKVRPASWATAGNDVIRGHLEGLVGGFDSAYWVREVRVPGDGDVTGLVDLTSEGIGQGEAESTDIPAAVVAGPPTPYVTRETLRTVAGASKANVLRGRLENVSELTIDLKRARLTLDGLDTSAITTNQAVTLRLVEGRKREDRTLP